ncbi:MAG: DUF255 domain-containing protein [Verrucomicrobia bacterium]|nr:DUF255 domain-containing protein [Verrucomicrobiota bacterium]
MTRLRMIRLLSPAMAALLLLPGTACRKRTRSAEMPVIEVPTLRRELMSNRVGDLPGLVYNSQAESPIRWQPWEARTFEMAKEAKRLSLAVVVMPQQPQFRQVLDILANDTATRDFIHEHYVPVLVDADASREIGLLTADLCTEIRQPLQLPMLLWMTHEGNPVAWIPVPLGDPLKMLNDVRQYHTMVSQIWTENPEYVVENSRRDNEVRRERMRRRKAGKIMSSKPDADSLDALRRLTSLYDPFTRRLDEAGGLFPAGALELLAVASQRPGLPEVLRARCLETTRQLLRDVTTSAMFDPLDGGVFTSRVGGSWRLPTYGRDCGMQARVVVALLEAYRATGDPLSLERALDVIGFAETAYLTSCGLFAIGSNPEVSTEAWMWNVEQIRELLPAEEAEWWIRVAEMKDLGNIPPEVDPARRYFRVNSMALPLPLAELARGRGQTLEACRQALRSCRSNLLEARDRRFGSQLRDETPHAGASLRMVSAYAAAYTATGDDQWKQKAAGLMQRCIDTFAADLRRIQVLAGEGPDTLVAARAFIHALAIQSALDVAAVTGEELWRLKAEDMATITAELFTGDGFLKEYPDSAALMDLPVTDLVMLFDDSTAGLVSFAESRLAEIGRLLVSSFSDLATPLPVYALERPILHTDLLLATLVRHFRVSVIWSADAPGGLREAVARLPLRMVQRRPANSGDSLPAGTVMVLLPDGKSTLVATPEELVKAVALPPGG